MDDLTRFINWLLSPLSRINRSQYNVGVFVVFIPKLLYAILHWGEMGARTASQFQNFSIHDPAQLTRTVNNLFQPQAAAHGPNYDLIFYTLGYIGLIILSDLRRKDLKWQIWTTALIAAPLLLTLLNNLLNITFGFLAWAILNFTAFILILMLAYKPSAPRTMPWEKAKKASNPQEDFDNY